MGNKFIEVQATCLETGETLTINVNGNKSMLDINNTLYNKYSAELDEQTTLENYLDHNWLADNILTIVNDYKVMSTPLNALLSDYAIYRMV